MADCSSRGCDKAGGRRTGARRQAVRQAAVELFAKKGYNATSTAEVAKAAGVSEGTVFYYFGSKEGIFLDLLAEVDRQYKEGLEPLLDSAPDGLSAMLACVDFHFQQVRHNRLLALLVRDLPASLVRGRSRSRQAVRKHNALLLEIMGRCLRRGQEDGSVDPDLPVLETNLVIRSLVIGATRLLLLGFAPEIDYAGQAVAFCRRALANRR